MVPVIEGWIEQWYLDVPGVSNTNENVPSFAMLPDVKAPESLVTVCAEGSAFVHVTRVPFATFNVEGSNANPLIATAAGADPDVPAVAVVVVVEVVFELAHPARSTANERPRTGNVMCPAIDARG